LNQTTFEKRFVDKWWIIFELDYGTLF